MPSSGNKTRNRIITTVTVIGVLVLLVILKPKSDTTSKAKANGPQKKVLVVDMWVAKPTQLINQFFSSGNILANESVDFKNEVPGRVTKILFIFRK